MVYYQSLLRTLEQWGLLDFVLPVLLIFTVAFAILQKAKIFKLPKTNDPNRKVNMILALGIALVAVIPHFTGQGPDVILMIASLLPNSIVIVIALLLCLLLMSLVTEKLSPGENAVAGVLALVAFVSLLVVILQAGGIISLPFLNFLLEPNTLAIFIILVVFALVVWFVAKKDEPAPATPAEPLTELKEKMKKLFGG